MLARLSIRDIVLIERLDIDFGSGLAALTGETGAGKSILLDAFALALGARGDVALVRHGAEHGQVTAAFELPGAHPVRDLMAANDIPADDELILRRVQFADGRTRALVDAATHRRLLDAYGGIERDADAIERLWGDLRARETALVTKRAEVERAQREADWLRHAVAELIDLGPRPTEETALAERRTAM